MRKLLPVRVAAGLACGALAFQAPAASAAHEHARCRFEAVSYHRVTGDGMYEGVAAGVAVAPGEPVTIRCVVRVNGQPRYATPAGPAAHGVATTSGYVGFVADPSDDVDMCAVVTTSHGTTEHCPTVPQPVRDVTAFVSDEVDRVLYESIDPALCRVLADTAPGVPSVVVEEDGDVVVNADRTWNCPPDGG